MHLINVRTHRLQEFVDETEVDYAILSHRWGEEEVTYQEMQSPELPLLKKGFRKIRYSCLRAEQDGYNYLWCDTCCINKESTAELSVCYVYLHDLSPESPDDMRDLESLMATCEWFQRGWTLQELIAPKFMAFFDQNWTFIGNKQSLCSILHRRTGIPEEVLLDAQSNMNKYSIAQRMSWASRRMTTRPEDIAYCLLGLFDVNMPMIYGEGKRAFVRLQEEIIKQVDDHSIFAWLYQYIEYDDSTVSGLLADHPSMFAHCGNFVVNPWLNSTSFSMTNRGLNVSFRATTCTTDTYIAALNVLKCHDPSFDLVPARVALFLQRQDEGDQYVRVACNGLGLLMLRTPIPNDNKSPKLNESDISLLPFDAKKWQLDPTVSPSSCPNKDIPRKLKESDFSLVPFNVRQRQIPARRRNCANAFKVAMTDSKGSWFITKTMTFNPPGEAPMSSTIVIESERISFDYVRLELDANLKPTICINAWRSSLQIWTNRGTADIYRPRSRWTEGKPFEISTPWKTLDSRPIHLPESVYVIKGSDAQEELDIRTSPTAQFKLYRSFADDGSMLWALDIEFHISGWRPDERDSLLAKLISNNSGEGFNIQYTEDLLLKT